MSMRNGNLPEGAILLTLELLEQATTEYVRLPSASARLGQEAHVRIRAIGRADYLAMLPKPAPGADNPELDAEQRIELTGRWMAGLPEDERAARQLQIAAVTYKVLAAGIVEPRVTEELARETFALDGDVIATAILKLSGLLGEEEVEASAPTEEAKIEPGQT